VSTYQHFGRITEHSGQLDIAIETAMRQINAFLGDLVGTRAFSYTTRSSPSMIASDGTVLTWEVVVDWRLQYDWATP
jgi:hypothetical protein